jgi:hypothetical protein
VWDRGTSAAMCTGPFSTSAPDHHEPPRSTSTMSKMKLQESQTPAKWQLVSWQKKEEQYAWIPYEWRLKSLPSAHVTNFLDIPRRCGLFTEKELHITEDFDATALAQAIRERKLKCMDVTRAFCKVHTPHAVRIN